MPRRRGPYGQYGAHGSSRLAQRRRLEAANPGHVVCRGCDALIPVGDAREHGGVVKTPYCVACIRERSRVNSRRGRSRRGPSDSELARLRRRQRDLAPLGLHWCVKCERELPFDAFPMWRGKPIGAVCSVCGRQRRRVIDAANQRRRLYRTSYLTSVLPSRGPLDRELRSFERRLTWCVHRVLRAIYPVCRRCHQHVDRYSSDGSRMRLGWCKCNDCSADSSAARKFKHRVLIPEAFNCRVRRVIVYDRDGGRCRYCGVDVPVNGWHLDHIVALSRGGSHTYDNVCVSCPDCNNAKSDLPVEVFMAQRGAA